MGLKDAARHRTFHGNGPGQVGRERHDACQGKVGTQGGDQGDDTPLGEARQQNVFRRHAPFDLFFHQLQQIVRGAQDAVHVYLRQQVHAVDVVPGRHDVATVHGDGNGRGIGKDEAQLPVRRQAQLGNDGNEVVAIRPQAMEPDHRTIRRTIGVDFETGRIFHHDYTHRKKRYTIRL